MNVTQTLFNRDGWGPTRKQSRVERLAAAIKKYGSLTFGELCYLAGMKPSTLYGYMRILRSMGLIVHQGGRFYLNDPYKLWTEEPRHHVL